MPFLLGIAFPNLANARISDSIRLNKQTRHKNEYWQISWWYHVAKDKTSTLVPPQTRLVHGYPQGWFYKISQFTNIFCWCFWFRALSLLFGVCGGLDISSFLIHKVGLKTLETPERITRPVKTPRRFMTGTLVCKKFSVKSNFFVPVLFQWRKRLKVFLRMIWICQTFTCPKVDTNLLLLLSKWLKS